MLDNSMTKFGMPVGPVTLADEVGIDVASHVASFLSEADLGVRMSGGDISLLRKLDEAKIPLEPVTVDGPTAFTRLLEMEKTPRLSDKDFPEGWVNFYRVDDYSSVSYFYLDKPFSNLPPLAPVAARIGSSK